MKPYRHVAKLLLLPLFAAPMLAQAATTYTTVEIASSHDIYDRFSVNALNNAGDIVGNWGNVAFMTVNDKVDYSPGRSAFTSNAVAINDAGQVVGSAKSSYNTKERGFLYSNGKMTFLNTLGGLTSSASGINQSGQISGTSMLANGRNHAFLYTNGAMRDIGTLGGGASSANALNDNGQVVGASSTKAGQTHAYIYSAGVMTDLGALSDGYSLANDISNTGQIVGASQGSDGTAHAFVYSNGVMTDLHSLIGGAKYTQATHINDAGQIIVSSDQGEFLYSNGAMVNIKTLVDPSLDLAYVYDADINNKGQISLTGGNGSYVLRLDPIAAVPEPETFGMLLGGLGLIGFMARRKAIKAKA